MILFNKIVQRKIDEETGIRDAKVEQDLLERKAEVYRADRIPFAKAPDAEIRIQGAPGYEYQCCGGNRRNDVLPFFDETEPWIKTQQEGNCE